MSQASTTDGMVHVCPGQIAVPGRNCWRIAHASRAVFLIDAAAYFAAFAQAVENAWRSIYPPSFPKPVVPRPSTPGNP